MVATDRLTEVLKTFARALVTDYGIEEMLDDLCHEVVAILGVDGAGVMLEDDAGDLRFVAASDDTVRRIESLQIDMKEGPCLTAYQTGELCLVRDLAVDDMFPEFSPRALAVGMASVQSFPLSAEGRCVGALNLYAAKPEALGDAEVEAGLLLADVATVYIMNCRTLAESHKLAGQLQQALDSRVVIEQAKGKLSEQQQVSVAEAFEILRRYARNNGRKLREVAVEVVDGTLKLDPSGSSQGADR